MLEYQLKHGLAAAPMQAADVAASA